MDRGGRGVCVCCTERDPTWWRIGSVTSRDPDKCCNLSLTLACSSVILSGCSSLQTSEWKFCSLVDSILGASLQGSPTADTLAFSVILTGSWFGREFSLSILATTPIRTGAGCCCILDLATILTAPP